MAQDSGAAEPIVGMFRSVKRAVNRLPGPPRIGRQDTSWHDDMVRRANDSFRQPAAQPAKRVPKRTAPRVAGRK
jgi:hypothetical protein